MIKIKVADIAKKNGIKNAYALQNALKCSPTMASRLWKGNFKQIGIETIDALCELLTCEPSDLLVFRSKVEKVKQTQEKPAREPGTVETSAPGEMMTTHQVAERLGLSRKRVNDYIISGELIATKGKQNRNFVSEPDLQKFMDGRK